MTDNLGVYAPPPIEREKIRADLSRNENSPSIADSDFRMNSKQVACYPDAKPLQSKIARQLQVDQQSVVVTAGGDEAIDRTIRWCARDFSVGEPKILTHHPTFEMFDVYAASSRCKLTGPAWLDGPFPTEEFLAELANDVCLVALVSPNNPTGRSIPLEAIQQITQAAESRGIQVLVDLAYVEFAEVDPTSWLLQNSEAVMIRSFSKAYGLAGMRLGYAVSRNRELADGMRNIGGPFPTSQPAIDLGLQALAEGTQELVERNRVYRGVLEEVVRQAGGTTLPSDANFVLAQFKDCLSVYELLLASGIAVRMFPDRPSLSQHLRITVPRSKCELGLLTKTLGMENIVQVLEPANQFARQEKSMNKTSSRTAQVTRKTRETDIACEINLDEHFTPQIETGLGFFDHMLTALAVHSKIGLNIRCHGDLDVDDHHSVEDCAIVLGTAIKQALGEQKGINRFGWALIPMDEALAQVAIDLSGRPSATVNLNLTREKLGDVATENLTHFFQSLAMELRCALHIDVLRGDNDHHKAEAAFKSLAQALGQAVGLTGDDSVPSTKGVL